MRSCWVVVAWVVGSLGISPEVVRGQGEPWVGAKVVTKYRAPLKIRGQVVDHDATFHVYTVERVHGDWLWLVSGSVSGWVRSGNVVPFDRAVDFYTQEIRTNPNGAHGYLGRGIIRQAKGEADTAIADFNEAIRLKMAFNRRGSIRANTREYDKAIADFNEAIHLDPKLAMAFCSRGAAWFTKQEYDKAIADFNEAIYLYPEYAMAFRNRGAAWCAKQEYDKAIADFTEAIRLYPKSAMAFNNRGAAWCAKQKYDKGIADFNEVIRLDPKDAMAFRNRGGAWSERQEYDRAIADYSEAIRLDPKNADGFHYRGDAWSAKKEYDKALADYTEAIRLDPKDAWAFNDRGWAWYSKQEYDKALADYTEAIRLDPEYARAYDCRAWIWATCPDEKYRDGKKAVESATRACELSQWKKAAFLDTLAAAHAEAGDFVKAVEFQEKANALFSNEDDREEGKERLKLYQDKKPYREKPGSVSGPVALRLSGWRLSSDPGLFAATPAKRWPGTTESLWAWLGNPSEGEAGTALLPAATQAFPR